MSGLIRGRNAPGSGPIALHLLVGTAGGNAQKSMTDKPGEDTFEPNRVRISGETEANVVALSLRLESDAIAIDTRTSTVSSERVTLPYERLESIRVVREATYTVIFETDRCEYTVTNLSANRAAISELVDYARAQGGLRTDRQSTGSTAETQDSTDAQTASDETEGKSDTEQEETANEETELDEWTWGETPGTD